MSRNFNLVVAAVAAGMLQCTFADPFGAPPDARHAWGVHDDYRPGVTKITADGIKPPSDAIVLFDGTAESIARNWCNSKGGPTKWKLRAATADRLDAEFDAKWGGEKIGRRLLAAWRVVTYKSTAERAARVKALEKEFAKAAAGRKKGDMPKEFGIGWGDINAYYGDLLGLGLIDDRNEVYRALKAMK